MNSLMDDNKLLTLANGERISMSPQVTLLFETEDLSTASPATVSRAGIVYCDYKKLGWKPYLESWLTQKTSQVNLRALVQKSTLVLPWRNLENESASITHSIC